MKKAWTLLEVMITLTIIAIAVGFALPSYYSQVVRSKVERARHHMVLVAQAERMYFAENEVWEPTAMGANNDDIGDPLTGTCTTNCTGFDLRAVDADPQFQFNVDTTGNATVQAQVATGNIRRCDAADGITITYDLVTEAWTLNACYRLPPGIENTW